MTEHQLTEPGWRVLTCAREEAVRLRAASVETDHLLSALTQITHDRLSTCLAALQIEGAALRAAVEGQARPTAEIPRPLPLSAQTTSVMDVAALAARLLNAPAVDVEHILLGILKVGGRAGEALGRAGVNAVDARHRVFDALALLREVREQLGDAPSPEVAERAARSVAEAREEARRRSETGIAHPRPFPADELTLTRETPAVAGRETELARLEELLGRGDRNSVFVIGPTGVGKRSLIRAYAHRRVEQAGDGHPRQQVYLFEPALARQAAPPIFMGEGAVVGRWLSEVLGRADTSLFAFSRFVSDEWVYDDFLEFVIPACVRRWVACVFLVTIEERRELARRHPELTNVTVELPMEPLPAPAALEIVRSRIRAWPREARLILADTAAEALVTLASKFPGGGALPGSALEILERTRLRVQQEYAPRIPDCEKSIDAVHMRIKEALERGASAEADTLRRERDRLLREYDERIEKLQEQRGAVVIGTGEIVKTVALMTGKPEAEIRAGGVWKA